ncbi:hypothetical protein VBY74_02110 [Tenacibaculum ascidiaceicola]|uniref:hypothetical protein n=1 Tax=Tenacibaculum ascidiaceicola TaxID=1699411 RepID=UPI0039E7C74C
MKNFEQINNELKLDNVLDWGIINSSGSRAKEFILYYNRNQNLIEDSNKIEFIDLICCSVNDAMIQNIFDNDLKVLFSNYIKNIEKNRLNSMILVNWSSYESTVEDPFPVSELIKRILVKN